MKRIKGDIWDFHEAFIVIPTNLEGVCGRGLAKQMVDRFPGVGQTLRNEGRTGQLANAWSNSECLTMYTPEIASGYGAGMPYYRLVPFPVKRSWRDEGNLDIIGRSMAMLVATLNLVQNPFYCVMPQVGCGFGELTPEVVLPFLDQFIVGPSQERILLIEPDPSVFGKYAGSFKPGWRSDKTAVKANVHDPNCQLPCCFNQT